MTSFPHRAWLVDLDGTLYYPIPVKVSMAVELLALGGIKALRYVRVFRQHHERVRTQQSSNSSAQLERGPSAFELQLSGAAQSLGVTSEELREVVESWMIQRPKPWIQRFRRKPLLAELAQFKAAGGRLALVSDYPAREKLRALDAEQLFDCVVASGEPGGPSMLKPHPEGMLKAARELGLPPEQCLVIGDRDDADGEAARRAGMGFRLVG